MAKPEKRDREGPAEFAWFAMELFPDELWPVSMVVGVVFTFVWFIGLVFRSLSGE